MKIIEYADLMSLNIELTYHANQNGRWTAKFENVDIKENIEDPFMISAYGNGTSPTDAMKDYIQRIKNSLLCWRRLGQSFKFACPNNLEV